jgi:hypothetical protein
VTVTLAQWRAARALINLSQIEMAKALGIGGGLQISHFRKR